MQGAASGVKTVDFVDSTQLLDDPVALRERAAEDGYLLFRELVPADDVHDLRRRMLAVVANYGWLAAGSDPMSGQTDREAFDRLPPEEVTFCGIGIPAAAYRDIQRIQQFHAFAHHPRLIEAFRVLFGSEVLPHARNIARVMIPSRHSAPTPPHQDYIHIQGTKQAWTAWLPLGDCPVDLGGLSVLVGSHREGVLPVKASTGAGGLEAYLCELDYPWAVGGLSAGDVLTFDSQTVHRGVSSRHTDLIRLSCDYRYQPAHEPIEQASLRVHCDVLDWEDIYAGWSDRSLAYYWRDQPLSYDDWDEALRWQKEKIC